MAFSFSFFAPPSTGDLYPEAGAEAPREEHAIQGGSTPWMMHEETYASQQDVIATPTAATAPASTPLPITGGLAALAVQQSTHEPLAPPSSRKLASYMTPGPAIAASLALAAQTSAPVASPPQPITHTVPSAPAPVATHFGSLHSLQNHDLAQLRVDLEREIELMRQDLFGAAMGVSALKDRIDGLELSTAKAIVAESVPQPTLSSAEIERLVRAWLNAHLPSHVEETVQKTLDQALQQTISTLSSSEFFRLPASCPGLPPDTFLSQAPLVISSSQS